MKVLQTSSVGFQEFRDVVGANFHSCLLPSAQHHQVTIFSLVMEFVKLTIPSKQQQKKGNCLTNSQTESHLWSKNCLNRQSASWRACLTSVSSFRNEALEWFVNLYAVHWLVLKYMQQLNVYSKFNQKQMLVTWIKPTRRNVFSVLLSTLRLWFL